MEKSECFIVENISGKTIILSDIRAEIGPGVTIDLAKVARRIDIERSFDLISAIRNKLLKLVKKTVEKVKIEKPLTEEQMRRLVEDATREAMRKSIDTGQTLDVTKLKEAIERQVAVSIREKMPTSDPSGIADKLDNLMKMMSNISTEGVAKTGEKSISPQVSQTELANIAQKGVDSISSEIKSSGESKVKKIKLNTQATDLAKELE